MQNNSITIKERLIKELEGYFGDANSRWRSDCIKSGDVDGFTLGTHDAVNSNGETYTYIVMKAS